MKTHRIQDTSPHQNKQKDWPQTTPHHTQKNDWPTSKRKSADIINFPIIHTPPPPPTSQSIQNGKDIQKCIQWLQENASQYKGYIVLLNKGELVHHFKSFSELKKNIDNTKGLFIAEV